VTAAAADNGSGLAGESPPTAAASLTGQAGVVILARALAFVSAFAVPIVLVRAINKESYGIYRQSLFIYSTFMPILQFGLTQSLYYFFPRDPEGRPGLVTQTHLILAGAGFAFAGVLILARGWVADYFGEPVMADYMFWIGPFVALMVVASTLEVMVIVEQKVRLTFWVIVGSEALRAALVLAAAVLTRDVGRMLAALALFAAARALFLLIHCRAERLLSLAAMDRGSLRQQLSYAIPFGFAGMVVTILTSVDRFYVSRFFDSEAFAVYSIGCFQLPVITIVFTSAISVLLGRMAELQKEGKRSEMLALWRRSNRKMSLVSIPMVVAFAILAREFVVGLFTAEYVGAVPIFITFLALIPRQSIPRADSLHHVVERGRSRHRRRPRLPARPSARAPGAGDRGGDRTVDRGRRASLAHAGTPRRGLATALPLGRSRPHHCPRRRPRPPPGLRPRAGRGAADRRSGGGLHGLPGGLLRDRDPGWPGRAG
jgi:O-antigen/teichoic acid export membrane protein